MTQEEILALLTPLAAYIASLPTTIPEPPEYPTPVAVKDDADFKALLTRVTQLQVPVRDNINAIKAITVSIQQIQELQEQDYLSQEDIRKQVDSILERLIVIEAKLSEDETPEPTDPVDPTDPPDEEEPTDPTDPPVDPEEPEEPTEPEEPPIENPDPDVPPVEEPPVSYIGTAAKVNAFTDTNTWLKGTFRSKPGFSIPFSDVNKLAFAKDAKIELADGQVRRINYSQVVGNNMTLLVDGPQVDAAKVGSPYSVVVTDKEIKEVPVEVPPVVEPPVTPPPTPPVTDPNADLVPAFGLNLGGGGNNPWLSVINGIGNDKAGTHYAPTQEIHIKEYVKNLKPGEQWLARLPIAGERLSEKSFDPLHVRYVNEIVAMMDMIHKYNGKVVIDVHNYFRWWKKVDAPIAGRDMKSHDDHLAKGHAVWTVIGEPDSPMSVDGFADFWVKILQSPIGKHPAFFCAGLVNEPHNRSQDGVDVDTKWPLAVPKLIDAVRSVDKDCWIAVAGNFYSSAKAWNVKTAAKMANITDPSDKLLFEAHQYMDQKGDGGGSWKSLTDPVVATQGTQDWAAYAKWLKDNNRRGYCGEVGGPATAGDYLTAARKLCDEVFIPNRIPCTFWMGGTGQNDDYANGMNRKDGTLKPNAAPLMERIGMMYRGYGPK